MKNLFLDTNVLIDFLAGRKPFSNEAARLFDYSLKKRIRLHISAVSYNNIYYIIRQTCSHVETIKMLTALNGWTEIIDVSKEIIKKSLNSEFRDFEDAIQYNCAKSANNIDILVTRNTKDFKSGSLPALTPKEAVTLIESLGLNA